MYNGIVIIKEVTTMTTKEQELKALARIEKIVADLGEDSYLSFAFEGCFDIAKDNIENDFACSMKQRWESACKEAESYKKESSDLKAEVKELKAEADTLKAKIIPDNIKSEIICTLQNYIYTMQKDRDDSEMSIMDFLRNTNNSVDDSDFQRSVIKMRVMRDMIESTTRLIHELKLNMD